MFNRMNEGLRQAIERAGSQNKLAQLLGITHQAVNKWQIVPVHHLIRVERLTGVHRALLRPDLYADQPPR
jgi:DNA-binding transcriptional regulator YdaS (Cro superfamily)